MSEWKETRSLHKDGIEGAKLMARMQGCICDVEVEIEGDTSAPGLYRAKVMHDDWCPLLRAREDRN